MSFNHFYKTFLEYKLNQFQDRVNSHAIKLPFPHISAQSYESMPSRMYTKIIRLPKYIYLVFEKNKFKYDELSDKEAMLTCTNELGQQFTLDFLVNRQMSCISFTYIFDYLDYGCAGQFTECIEGKEDNILPSLWNMYHIFNLFTEEVIKEFNITIGLN